MEWVNIAVQVVLTVIPVLLYVERRITRLEVKVDALWKAWLDNNPRKEGK